MPNAIVAIGLRHEHNLTISIVKPAGAPRRTTTASCACGWHTQVTYKSEAYVAYMRHLNATLED